MISTSSPKGRAMRCQRMVVEAKMPLQIVCQVLAAIFHRLTAVVGPCPFSTALPRSSLVHSSFDLNSTSCIMVEIKTWFWWYSYRSYILIYQMSRSFPTKSDKLSTIYVFAVVFGLVLCRNMGFTAKHKLHSEISITYRGGWFGAVTTGRPDHATVKGRPDKRNLRTPNLTFPLSLWPHLLHHLPSQIHQKSIQNQFKIQWLSLWRAV